MNFTNMKSVGVIGSIFYMLWGLVHIIGGGAIIAGASNPTAVMSMFATANPASVGEPGQAVAGLAAFHGWNIAWMGVASIAMAWFLNRQNSIAGFWINGALVAVADLGLFFFLLKPGYMSWSDGWIGPALFFPAVLFTALGVKAQCSGEALASSASPEAA